MITFFNVTKHYPDGTIALDNVNLQIESGEFLFIVGPSGAGKSTLLKLMIREEKPTSGTVSIDNVIVNELKANSLPFLRRQIGVVFQDFKLLPWLNAWDNIQFALEVVGRSKKQIATIVPEVLDLVNLSGKEASYVNQLSGGERQRLAIARAIATEPRVLLADEPTGNIDMPSSWEIMDLIERINKMGTTVLVTTHNKEIVDKMKKRVIALSKGAIIKDEKEGKYAWQNH